MPDLNRSLPRIDPSRFSMVPRGDLPRSTFVTTHSLKSTFNAGPLVPIHVDEVLPGDVHQGQITIFARLATPLFPIMDRLELETFFFFVPNRILWVNWKKFMGERTNPADSISFILPTIDIDAAVNVAGSIYDYMGVPGAGQLTGAKTINALPMRAYNRIWTDWFRDQNLQNEIINDTDDGPDTPTNYGLMNRNKKHDYFTSALPWPLKGGVEVTLPGNVQGISLNNTLDPIDGSPTSGYEVGGTLATGWGGHLAGTSLMFRTLSAGASTTGPLITVSSTINALRLAVATQRLLEKDARSGTRYTELLLAHFGVRPEDSRLQRPEYIGGGRTDVQTSAIPQTSATGLTGGSSPLGALGAAAIITDQHSFSYHATEHGYIIGLANVRAELTYQQGLARLWTRQTRYDFYWPVFANLGEQVVRNDEIYSIQNGAQDSGPFGYQERWAEYRHRPSRITGLFKSTATGTIDPWHLAQKFTALPALNTAFIVDQPPLSRALAAGAAADKMQILFDSVFRIKTTRPMPMFSVPGLSDRF